MVGREKIPEVVMICTADGASTGLAEPGALGSALTKIVLDYF